MTVQRTEIGLVSAGNELVGFYREVFELDELDPRELPTGKVHRLGHGEAVLKVMVPAEPPRPAAPARQTFWDTAGLQYFTLWVSGLDEVASRCEAGGGTIAVGPIDLRPGVRTMVVHDPDGNVIEVMEDSSR